MNTFLRILNIFFSASSGSLWAQSIMWALDHNYEVAIILLAASVACLFFSIAILLYRLADR